MRLNDFEEKILDDFLGLYMRGSEENVPEGYFPNCLNMDFEKGQCYTRGGLSLSVSLGYGSGNGKVLRFANFNNQYGLITLILDDAGNLYTYSARTSDTATTPRITVSSAKDFAAIQMLGKIFIAFSDGKNGLSGVNLKVFIPAATIGSDEFRDAAGLAPTAGGFIGAADGGDGNIAPGAYRISVAYITNTGFITQPGPKITGVFSPSVIDTGAFTTRGGYKFDISSIPTGPTGTAKRQLLITKTSGAEYFFIPSANGGLIANNSSTTATINFNSVTDLIDSADYLFDVAETIATPLGLQDFNGRLAIYGMKSDPNIVKFSDVGELENFTNDGINIINKDAGFEIRNSLVLRNVFYVFTELGVYGLIDNGDIPATWTPISIDRSINVPSHGIASFFDISGIKVARDFSLIIDKSGILIFDGTIRKPAITDNIDSYWQRINFGMFHKAVLVVDEQKHKIYCTLPINSNGEASNNTLLMGDYNSCPGKIPSANGIKWSIWLFKPAGVTRGISHLGLIKLSGDDVPQLRLASDSGGGRLWKLASTGGQDEVSDFESYIETSLLFWNSGSVHTFVAIGINTQGLGELRTTVRGSNDINITQLQDYLLSLTPIGEKVLKCNFQGEKAKFRIGTLSGVFLLNTLRVYGKATFTMRPD